MTNYKPFGKAGIGWGGITRQIPNDVTLKTLSYAYMGANTVKSLHDAALSGAPFDYVVPAGKYLHVTGVGLTGSGAPAATPVQFGKGSTTDVMGAVRFECAAGSVGQYWFTCHFILDGNKYLVCDMNGNTNVEVVEAFGYENDSST